LPNLIDHDRLSKPKADRGFWSNGPGIPCLKFIHPTREWMTLALTWEKN